MLKARHFTLSGKILALLEFDGSNVICHVSHCSIPPSFNSSL